jgi:PIN domain nuclease of toxin-antitoxin system
VIVLDTHAWVWLVAKPERLGKQAMRAIRKATRLGVPAICVWEVAVKARSKRLRLDRPCDVWVEAALNDDPRIEVLPLLPSIALGAAELSWEHADPADRFIVATARVHDAPLVTADEAIRASKLVPTLWD